MVAISLIRAQNCADDINRLFVVRVKIHRFFQNADDHHTMRQISKHRMRNSCATANGGAAEAFGDWYLFGAQELISGLPTFFCYAIYIRNNGL